MIKACIFDLDGTLADTLESMAYITNIIMEKFGLKTLPVDNFRGCQHADPQGTERCR